jgi:hypothetical protein
MRKVAWGGLSDVLNRKHRPHVFNNELGPTMTVLLGFLLEWSTGLSDLQQRDNDL